MVYNIIITFVHFYFNTWPVPGFIKYYKVFIISHLIIINNLIVFRKINIRKVFKIVYVFAYYIVVLPTQVNIGVFLFDRLIVQLT